MRRLILYFYLIFFSISVHAIGEDISDFEIDGISVGASALKYFNNKEILKKTKKIWTHCFKRRFKGIFICANVCFIKQ